MKIIDVIEGFYDLLALVIYSYKNEFQFIHSDQEAKSERHSPESDYSPHCCSHYSFRFLRV